MGQEKNVDSLDTPEEMAMYYNSGTLGGFSTKLMDLIGFADIENRKKLKEAFPRHFEGWRLWFRGEYPGSDK